MKYLKNYFFLVVDLNRVCLSDPHETGNDYINASFIGVSKTL